MIDKLVDKLFDKKKSKNTEEELYYDDENYDEVGFGYEERINTNEFNDATIEYGDGEEHPEEIIFDEEEPKKNKLLFWGLIGLVILLILLVIILRSCVLTNGKLKKVTIVAPDVIYVDEKSEVKASASGKGNLRNTKFKFEVSNEGIVELENNEQNSGKTVKQFLNPKAPGEFVLSVIGSLEDVKLERVEKIITVCRNLTNESFATDEITIVKNKTTRINMDLGVSDLCYSSLNYKINDNSLATIDENGNITGIKEGKTTIKISNGDKTIEKIINVIDDENTIKVTGIKVSKTKVSMYIGAKEQINATISPNNATNKNINWTSSNEGVVTVTNKGLLTGIGKGTAIVTGATADGNYKVMITVTVTEKPTSTQTPSTNKDTKAPVLSVVKIYSNNSNQKYAKLGNTITVEINANETLKTKPSISIAGTPVVVTCSNSTCKGSLRVTSSTKEGLANLKISGYKDNAGNTGSIVEKTTDWSSVIIDRTLPSCSTSVSSDTTSASIIKFSWYDKTSGIKNVNQPNGITQSYSCSTTSTYKEYNFTKQSSVKTYTMTLTDCAGNINTCNYQVGVATKEFTVTIDSSNTGVSAVSADSVSCDTAGASCKVKLPTITAKSGYSVRGFNASKSATTATYKSGEEITISSNMKLYAIVKKNSGTSGGGTTPTTPEDDDDSSTTTNGPCTKEVCECKVYSGDYTNSCVEQTCVKINYTVCPD